VDCQLNTSKLVRPRGDTRPQHHREVHKEEQERRGPLECVNTKPVKVPRRAPYLTLWDVPSVAHFGRGAK
jgi:hypothetical protein